jgi:hypothetical protein
VYLIEIRPRCQAPKRGLTMDATPRRFVRRTTLGEDEYRKNFRQIDRDAIDLLKSAEAKRVTRLMGTLYLTLIDAPPEFWEREGVLRFSGGGEEGGGTQTAWQQLVALLDCGNTTAKKALDWMHAQGVIGYYAGKNGAGIRIFLNRAAASIGSRGRQKNLRLVPTPTSPSHTPAAGMPFNDSFADLEVLDSDRDPRAPKNSATELKTLVSKEIPAPDSLPSGTARSSALQSSPHSRSGRDGANHLDSDELIEKLTREIVPRIGAAAAREHERTREWFDRHALPKAVRVAQRSAYDVLRAHGIMNEPGARKSRHAQSVAEVGRSATTRAVPEPLSEEEVAEMASVCVTMLEVHGRPVEHTLSEMGTAAGGFLLPSDAPKVRAAAESLVLASNGCRLEGERS